MSKPQATAETQAVKLGQLQATAMELLLPAHPLCSWGGPGQNMTPGGKFLPGTQMSCVPAQVVWGLIPLLEDPKGRVELVWTATPTAQYIPQGILGINI